jgi:myo-inositol-1(or 4)-monophosphatase
VAQPAAEELLDLAHEVAQLAGAQLRERFDRGQERALRAKSTPTDLVSEADLASERVIRETLSLRRPDDGFLGEEGGSSRPGSSGLGWVVDPLDGTVNFLFGIPQWCVSVAVEDNEGAVAGVIFDPMRDETVAAVRNGPVTLDRAPIAGSQHDELATSMVATGFAYDADVRAAQAEVLAAVIPRVRDVRRMGSAALDLAWTACGRYDAYYERALRPWDMAAGALICERAGLDVRPLPPAGGLPAGLLVAAGAIVVPLAQLVGA